MAPTDLKPPLPNLDRLCATLGWPAPAAITKLHGDASARTYYRVRHTDQTTRILMVMPEGKASASEEITNFQGALPEPPFLALARNFSDAGLPIPHVLHYSPADRWIVLEDIGDTVLAHHVARSAPAERARWYRQAIDLLLRMQAAMDALPRERCIAHRRSFDPALLNWEFDHFREYLLEARGQTLPAPAARTFTELTRAITADIAALPATFVHRDFQSRNLMVRSDALVLIDFQDALRGPYVYDLVALLRDSYIAFAPEECRTLVAYFADRSNRDRALVQAHFDLVTVQRKMKDAGRFVYIDRVKRNPNFLPFIPNSLRYVREALERTVLYRPLLDLLIPFVPEWQTVPPDGQA